MKRTLSEENGRLKAENKLLWMDVYLRDMKREDSGCVESDTLAGCLEAFSEDSCSEAATANYTLDVCSPSGAIPCLTSAYGPAGSTLAKSLDAPDTPAQWDGGNESMPSELTAPLHSWRSTASAHEDSPVLLPHGHMSDDEDSTQSWPGAEEQGYGAVLHELQQQGADVQGTLRRPMHKQLSYGDVESQFSRLVI